MSQELRFRRACKRTLAILSFLQDTFLLGAKAFFQFFRSQPTEKRCEITLR